MNEQSALAASSRRVALLGFLVLFAFAFAFWGGRSLMDSSEARYGEVAREMLRDGDWLVPHLHGHPHLTKPPLAYWMFAGGMRLLGANAWGARLPLAACFTGTVIALLVAARSMVAEREKALGACLVYATGAFSSASSYVLTTDPLLTFFVAAGIAAWWRDQRQASALAWWAFCICFGLAFMTKGPPALLHLIPIVALSLRASRRGRIRPRRVVGAAAIIFVVGCWWYLVMIQRDPSLLAYYLKDEVVERIATSKHGRDNSPLVYLLILALGTFPWIFLWKPVLVRLGRIARSPRGQGGAPRLPDPDFFLLVWLLAPLVVFVFSKSRMPLYILPLFLPLSLLFGSQMGAAIDWLGRQAKPRRALVWGALGLWVALVVGARALPDSFNARRSNREKGLQLASALAALQPPEENLAWLFTRPQHGVSFYMDRTVHDLDLKEFRDVVPWLGSRDLASWLFVADPDELGPLDEWDIAHERLATAGDLVVLRLKPTG